MPATVFTAGDNQFPWGQIEDFQDPNGYSGTWGRGPLKAITCATVGNHEYLDRRTGPAGFLDSFSPNCPHRPDVEYARTSGGAIIGTAYAFRPAPGVGLVGVRPRQPVHPPRQPADRVRPQLRPDRQHAQLVPRPHGHAPGQVPAGHLAPPRWISGDARADEDVRVDELYNVSAYQGRISLILNGHSHSYQRFASMLADGRIDPTYRAGPASSTPPTAPSWTGPAPAARGAGGRPGAGSSTMGP